MEGLIYESIQVDGTANEETVEPLITSTEEEPKEVLTLFFIEVTAAAEENDAVLAAYIERERILDASIKQFLRLHDAANSTHAERKVDLGFDLPVGQSLKVGHTSGATASDIIYTVVYRLKA